MAVTLTPRRAVVLVAAVFLGLGAVQTYAAVAVPESDQLAVIRWSAVGMLLLLGLVVMLLRGMIRVEGSASSPAGDPGEAGDVGDDTAEGPDGSRRDRSSAGTADRPEARDRDAG